MRTTHIYHEISSEINLNQHSTSNINNSQTNLAITTRYIVNNSNGVGRDRKQRNEYFHKRSTSYIRRSGKAIWSSADYRATSSEGWSLLKDPFPIQRPLGALGNI